MTPQRMTPQRMTPQRLSPQKMHLASRTPVDQGEEELSEEDEPYQEVCSGEFSQGESKFTQAF